MLIQTLSFRGRVSPWIGTLVLPGWRAGATRRRAKVDTGRRVLREGGKETERQLSRFQNRRVARARHSLGGHPCDLPEEFTGRPGSARAGSSPNLDSKARGEGTPDPDQPRNREPATLHGSGSSSGFLKPARTGAPLLPHSPSRAISNRFLIEGSRGGEELLLLSRGLKFTLCLFECGSFFRIFTD